MLLYLLSFMKSAQIVSATQHYTLYFQAGTMEKSSVTNQFYKLSLKRVKVIWVSFKLLFKQNILQTNLLVKTTSPRCMLGKVKPMYMTTKSTD